MGYEKALELAWKNIEGLVRDANLSQKLLSDTYTVDITKKEILSSSCNIPAKIHVQILILHYLARKLSGVKMPEMAGEWIDFNQLEGGEEYYPTFKKRTIDHLLKKFGSDPEGLLERAEPLPEGKGGSLDVGAVVYPFNGVPIFMTMSRADEEFGPDANIFFDKTISEIFCTEDIVVLTEFVIHSL